MAPPPAPEKDHPKKDLISRRVLGFLVTAAKCVCWYTTFKDGNSAHANDKILTDLPERLNEALNKLLTNR